MYRLPPALKAKGLKAEADFRAWLDWSAAPHIYVEQSPVTVPEALRGRIKRPDFLVGVPHVGLLAFDVKAKSVYDDALIFDLAEVRKLATFRRAFHVTVYLACLDDEREGMWWVALDDLFMREPERRGRRAVVAFPLAEAHRVEMGRRFQDALVDLSRTSIAPR